MELPAFKKYISPLFAKADLEENEFQRIVFGLEKTWYIAPVGLVQIENAVLGVEAFDSKTEQHANHGEKEIWIDSRKHNLKTEEEQAKTILHEMTMALYLVKYESFASAKYQKSLGEMSVIPYIARILEHQSPPEKKRLLNKTDYGNIRGMTAWLLQQTPPVDNEILIAKYRSYDFDKRIFKKGQAVKSDEDYVYEELSVPELREVILKTQLLGGLPNLCNIGLGHGEEIDCGIRFVDKSLTDYSDQEERGVFNKYLISMEVKLAGSTFMKSIDLFSSRSNLYLSHAEGYYTNYSFSAHSDVVAKKGESVEMLEFGFDNVAEGPRGSENFMLTWVRRSRSTVIDVHDSEFIEKNMDSGRYNETVSCDVLASRDFSQNPKDDFIQVKLWDEDTFMRYTFEEYINKQQDELSKLSCY